MDPIESINIDTDTSFALMEIAQARGDTLFVYEPKSIWYDTGRVFARARPVTVKRQKGKHFKAGKPVILELAHDADVVLMRQDPPFDMAYLTAAHLLEQVSKTCLVVNDPFWVRCSPEKIFPTLFPHLQPPTLITRDREAINAFRSVHKDIICKPLYGFGGGDVFRVKPNDPNLGSILDVMFAMRPEPIVVQAFLPAIAEGDKRLLLVDGELAGGFNRKPPKGAVRSNMRAGGTPEPTEITDAERAVCAEIGPELKRRGLVLVGIDLIGGKLTEVNVTSPTGVMPLRWFGGPDVAQLVWHAIDRRLAERTRSLS
jgi:glutathione synthase